MKTVLQSTALLVLAGLFLASCEWTKSPTEGLSQRQTTTSTQPGETTQSLALPQSDTLGGFILTYLGRTFDLVNQTTTFSYNLSGSTSQVSVVLEDPSCTVGPLVAYNPTQGVNFNVDPVIEPSIRWNPPTTSSTSLNFNFSYTFGGIEKEGPIQAGVKTTSASYYGVITGPSKYFNITGTVYTDANTNGLLDAGEPGIVNVTVNLINSSNTVVASSVTDINGSYSFLDQLCGTYTVAVDTTTLTALTKNKYFQATTPTTLSVSIGPDSPGNNFGFNPNAQKLINDLKSGALFTNGASANQWKKQFSVAVTGNGNASVSKDTLLAYLGRINTLELPYPFQFTLDSAGLASALNILSNPTKTDLSNLLQQLLATELNYERGIGLTDQTLQLALIGWGESIAASASPAASLNIKSFSTQSTSLTTSTSVFSGINSGGGGGVL